MIGPYTRQDFEVDLDALQARLDDASWAATRTPGTLPSWAAERVDTGDQVLRGEKLGETYLIFATGCIEGIDGIGALADTVKEIVAEFDQC